MNMPKQLFIFTLCLLTFLSVGRIDAQESDEIGLTWQALRAEKRDLVANALQLSEEEGQAFWPLYNEYEKSIEVLDKRTVSLISKHFGVYEKLSDEQVKALLDETLEIQQEKLELVKSSIEKFKEVLPFIKVAQFYQVANKVEAFIEFELAKQIPLIQ